MNPLLLQQYIIKHIFCKLIHFIAFISNIIHISFGLLSKKVSLKSNIYNTLRHTNMNIIVHN